MMHIIESGDVAKPVATLLPLTKLSSNYAYYSTFCRSVRSAIMAHRVLALRVPRLDHFPGHLLLQDEGGRRSTVGNKGRVIDFA